MATASPTKATLDDLSKEPGRAELIGGRIVRYMAVGHRPNRAAGRIFRSLAEHADQIGRGYAYTDSMGFAVPELTSGRQSFSPDAAYYDGPLPANPMRFIEGPPTLAVEVRSEGDYTPSAEREMAAKRLDYFEAGTAVVWDVDPIAEKITAYRSAALDAPVVYVRGQVAEAEPLVPGWRVDVDWVFN
jgi:Uma2 family endonuclease